MMDTANVEYLDYTAHSHSFLLLKNETWSYSHLFNQKIMDIGAL